MSDGAHETEQPSGIRSGSLIELSIDAIEAEALQSRAPGYTRLYDELRQRLEMGDA